jgi:hypothetical protein
MNKKGIVFTRPRDTISFFIGLLLFALGVIPLLASLNVIGWNLPAFLNNVVAQVFIWIIAVAGLYIIIDGFIEPPAHNLHWILIAMGLVLFVVGLLPILFTFGVLGWDLGTFLNKLYIYNAIITLEGLLLMIGGLTEH